MFSFLVFGLSLKDSASPFYSKLIHFHDLSLNMLIIISFLMIISLVEVWISKVSSLNFMDNKVLEIVWTVIPAIILIFLAVPSLSLLYYMDLPSTNNKFGDLVKVVGHQWYWSYEYSSKKFGLLSYDSFLVNIEDLNLGGFRLLETDKPLILEVFKSKLIQGSSEDVIHCWACPSLGLKFDVIPGRLNSAFLILTQLGSFYGQCSEICGANHSFMPMEVESVL